MCSNPSPELCGPSQADWLQLCLLLSKGLSREDAFQNYGDYGVEWGLEILTKIPMFGFLVLSGWLVISTYTKAALLSPHLDPFDDPN